MNQLRYPICALLGVTILLLGSWLECHSDQLFSVAWPNGTRQPLYSAEITHLAWVVMVAGAALSLIAATIWMQYGVLRSER